MTDPVHVKPVVSARRLQGSGCRDGRALVWAQVLLSPCACLSCSTPCCLLSAGKANAVSDICGRFCCLLAVQESHTACRSAELGGAGRDLHAAQGVLDSSLCCAAAALVSPDPGLMGCHCGSASSSGDHGNSFACAAASPIWPQQLLQWDRNSLGLSGLRL